MDSIEVTIVNWSTHNPRSTIKHPRWFALSNRILEDPDFFDFSDSEFKAWIYILCQASQRNSSTISLNLRHAEKVCGLKTSIIQSCLAKLLKAECIQLRDHGVNTCVPIMITTEHNKTGQDKTLTSTKADASVEKISGKILGSEWNDKILDCPKFRGWPKSRDDAAKRFLEHHTIADWLEIIKKINESEFLSGKNGKWRAGIDWALKPANAAKVLENNYENRSGGDVGNDENENEAKKILEGIKKFSSHESAKLQAFLGADLFRRACRLPGGIAGIRSAPSGPFAVKNLTGALRNL